jgi:alkylhydroperoxidase/carboxymuconolactone decarboxylase family protein YurZ
MEGVQKIAWASKLDQKTSELAYIAVLAAVRLEGGVSFHVKQAKELGAARDEIISAILVGLPAV